jgi:hypothetical protein
VFAKQLWNDTGSKTLTRVDMKKRKAMTKSFKTLWFVGLFLLTMFFADPPIQNRFGMDPGWIR